MHFLTARYTLLVAFFCLIGAIGVGALLLCLPGVLTSGSLSLIDAYFTSASAICVTGMSVIPFEQLSTFGQSLLLFLIQMGGVGFTIVLIFAALFFAKSGLQWHVLAVHIFETIHFKKIKGLIKTIILMTVFVECIGGVLFYAIAYFYKLPISFFQSFFQSVNLFCNAGFLLSDASHDLLMTPLGMLLAGIIITIGNLGFLYFFEIFERIQAKRAGKPYLLSLTSRVAIRVYVFSTIIAFVIFFLTSHESWGNALAPAFFNALSLRGCGMITAVGLNIFSAKMIFFIVLYSCMGGAPLSTSSGIKTSIIGTIYATGRSFIKGSKQIILCDRNISSDVVIKSHFFCFYLALTVILLTFLLDVLTGSTYTLNQLFIESMATITNSGISYGFFSYFPWAAKLVLTIGMIVGRLGALIFLLSAKTENEVVKYPEDHLVLL